MNIIVTGGSGFIGSHLLLALCKQYPDYSIVNVDIETYAARRPLYVAKPKNLHHEKLDIRDSLGVHRLYEKFQPEATIHLAAESHVCRSITGPRDFATTNLLGTFNLLEAHHSTKGLKFVHVSTDEVFGHIRSGKFNEHSPMLPRSPYSASKAGSDMMVQAYHHTYGMDTCTVNMSNNFGPNQHEEKLVPQTISKILLGRPVTIHGRGDHVRDWLWVGDAVDGILRAFMHGRPGESYCLGGNKELTNMDLVREISSAINFMQGPTSYTIEHKNDRPTDDFRYALDTTKAERELAWSPNIKKFRNRIMKTVQWYAHAMISSGAVTHGRGD